MVEVLHVVVENGPKQIVYVVLFLVLVFYLLEHPVVDLLLQLPSQVGSNDFTLLYSLLLVLSLSLLSF